jgi:hypothetical protein
MRHKDAGRTSFVFILEQSEGRIEHMLSRFTKSIKSVAAKTALIGAMVASAVVALPRPASADTTSTIAIAAAAALIVGAIAYDNSGRPYYMRDGRRWYVSNDVGAYWERNRGYYGQLPSRYGRQPSRYGRDRWNDQRGYRPPQ